MKLANKRGQKIDKTHLSIDMAEERGIVHRDYLAHCHRWSHVVKHLYKSSNYANAFIMDIGCGREMPLAKLLYSNKLIPKKYYGVDVNKLDPPQMLQQPKIAERMVLFGETDVCDLNLETNVSGFNANDLLWYDRPNIITCFEVLEHVEPEHSIRILKKIHELLTDDGVAFISTPNFNGKAAANHVNEMRFKVLGKIISDLGFTIEGCFGTFASQKDIEPCLQYAAYCCSDGTAYVYQAYKELKEYYDSNVLATLFAPLFPDKSRNALWVLTKQKQGLYDEITSTAPGWDEEFRDLTWSQIYNELTYTDGEEIPWSSSLNWEDLKPINWRDSVL